MRIVTDTPDRERTVMSERDAFDRVLASVPDVTLDETRLAGHLGPDRRGLRPERQWPHGR